MNLRSNMKATCLFRVTRLVAIVALGLLAIEGSRAQSPSGPITATPTQASPPTGANPALLPAPRTTILGAWKFNPDDSDDPRKRREDSRGSNGGYGGGRGRMGGGYPGEGRGGYGRGGGGGGEKGEEKREGFLAGKKHSPPNKGGGRGLGGVPRGPGGVLD